MNDIALSPRARARQHEVDTDTYAALVQRDATVRARLAWCVVAVSMTANVALAGAIAAMQPLVRIEPAIAVLHDDGTSDVYRNVHALSDTDRAKVLRQTLWQYVEDRESYSYSIEIQRPRWERVSLISSEEERLAYQKWFRHDTNPSGPEATLAPDGKVYLEYEDPLIIDGRAAWVHYLKHTYTKSGEWKTQRVTAAVTYALDDTISEKMRRQSKNPLGVRVSRYDLQEKPTQ